MNEATLAALTALATKLSTTVEYLWGVLIVQATLSATISAGIFLCLYLILGVWAFAVYKGAQKDPAKQDNRYHSTYWENDTILYNLVAVGGMFAILTLTLSCEIESILSRFINPEYWALLQLASIIK